MAKKDKSAKAKSEELKKKKGKGSKSEDKKEDIQPRDVKGDNWDEQQGGGDFFKLPKGENECLIRIRSVVSVGQCVFEFNGKKDTKATSGIALVLECWPFKEKKGKLKITSDQPAIVYGTFKALRGNKDSNWSKMLDELKAKTPADLQNSVGVGTVFSSDKGYMYLRKYIQKTGLAEKQACPKLTQKGFTVPNLNAMSKGALMDLNPIFQVSDYVLKAVNYPGSVAEEVVKKIRKDKPNFAVPKDPKAKDGKGKGKGGKKGKKKLDPKKEY